MQPDLVAPGDKAAAEKSFKEVSEAYAKLTGSESFPACVVYEMMLSKVIDTSSP